MKRSKGAEKYPVPVPGASVLKVGDGGLDIIVEVWALSLNNARSAEWTSQKEGNAHVDTGRLKW